MKPIMWTFNEGKAVVDSVQLAVRAFGYHVALGGGVLNAGESTKDLDLYFLPLDNDGEVSRDDLVEFLEEKWGLSSEIDDPAYGVSEHYARKLKFVVPGATQETRKRIDVFITR